MTKQAPDVFEPDDAGVDIFVPSPMGSILNDVLDERRRQHAKWGEQNHDPGTWQLILDEELGEYAEAQLHTKFGGPKAGNVRKELVQVAAVAIAMLECWDRNQMKGGTLTETGGIPDNIKRTLADMCQKLYKYTESEGDVESIAEIREFFGLDNG